MSYETRVCHNLIHRGESSLQCNAAGGADIAALELPRPVYDLCGAVVCTSVKRNLI